MNSTPKSLAVHPQVLRHSSAAFDALRMKQTEGRAGRVGSITADSRTQWSAAFMPLPCRKTSISGFLAASENLDAEAA
jgi:hypothetical protein